LGPKGLDRTIGFCHTLTMVKIVEVSDPNDSSSGKSYETICHEDGKLACQCRGWATKKLGKARTCKHVDDLVSKHNLTTVVRGDYRYAMDPTLHGNAPSSVPVIPVPKPKKAVAPVAAPVSTKKKRFNTIAEPDEEPEAAQYVNPMLASPFPDGQTLENFCASSSVKDWAMEEKFDGHRVIVTVNEGVVKAWSRPRTGKAALVRILPPHLVKSFAKLPTGTYDGEIMIPGGKSYNVTDGKFAGTEIFIIFDILSLLGMSVVSESYDARRAYLEEIFSRPESKSDYVDIAKSVEPSVEFVQAIWARGGEGAILKRRAARYQPGARSRDFIKVKALGTIVLYVGGYEDGKNGPHSVLVLNHSTGMYATKVKALDNAMLRVLDADPNVYIGRAIRIEFQERTPDGSFRHPRIDRWENE
jgi:hypothetical protein